MENGRFRERFVEEGAQLVARFDGGSWRYPRRAPELVALGAAGVWICAACDLE